MRFALAGWCSGIDHAFGRGDIGAEQARVDQGVEAEDSEGRDAASEKRAALYAFAVRAVVHGVVSSW